MKNRGCLFAAVAIVVIVLMNLVAWVFGPSVVADDDLGGSSFSNAPAGARGLALLYERYGYDIAQRRSSFEDMTDLDPARDVVFIACTFEEFRPDEIRNLDDWVRSGGRLVLIEPVRGGVSSSLVPGAELQMSNRFVSPADSPGLATRNSCSIPFYKDDAPAQELTAYPGLVSPLTDAVTEVRVPAGLVHTRTGPAVPVAGTDAGAVVSVFHQGSGEIVIVASNIFSNATLASADNAQLALNLAAGAKRAVFDEYHLGYRQSGGAVVAMPVQWRWAFLGVLVAIVAYAWAKAPRKSAPAEEPPVLPRTRGEFIDALALSMERANGSQAAARILQDDLRSRLRRRLFLRGSVTDQQIVGASATLGIDPARVASALRPTSPEDDALLSRAREIAMLRREL